MLVVGYRATIVMPGNGRLGPLMARAGAITLVGLVPFYRQTFAQLRLHLRGLALLIMDTVDMNVVGWMCLLN